jgi:Pyruvate:ferredoxin oxidoreductase and related 2-oxoacid:ferredoxin oxidoreductases, alpha subunit
MGSGCDAAHETVDYLTSRGEKVAVLKVRLYRPFDVERFAEALPASVKAISALDRTKEPGSAGEPLYLDCVNALHETGRSGVRIVGGRYGLSSKEFTPAMIKAALDNLAGPDRKTILLSASTTI